MEGNECYKFSTIREYIRRTGSSEVRVACDVGSNAGFVTRMIRDYFPTCEIFAFEPVEDCFRETVTRTAGDPAIHCFQLAVTSQHLFEDDLGRVPRAEVQPLRVFRGLPAGGPGWYGGSLIRPESFQDYHRDHYRVEDRPIQPITFDQMVESALASTGANEIDLVKMDCEGSEIPALGCAASETLQRCRFIVGEYHGIERFYQVMREKLFQTHFVSLIGDAHLGSFFAERKGEITSILNPDRDGMLVERPWLADQPIDWHVFREEYVLPNERHFHALASAEVCI
ncbi:MAG: hypothetical protein JWM11_1803 [Planctomycetaceae bacterium]|nr:hypothetical protein [Planctomycetaceae bacterium]